MTIIATCEPLVRLLVVQLALNANRRARSQHISAIQLSSPPLARPRQPMQFRPAVHALAPMSHYISALHRMGEPVARLVIHVWPIVNAQRPMSRLQLLTEYPVGVQLIRLHVLPALVVAAVISDRRVPTLEQARSVGQILLGPRACVPLRMVRLLVSKQQTTDYLLVQKLALVLELVLESV